MKAGIKTTEFWITAATDVALLASALAGVLPAKWAAIAASVSTAAYGIARGLAKQGAGAGA